MSIRSHARGRVHVRFTNDVALKLYVFGARGTAKTHSEAERPHGEEPCGCKIPLLRV